MLQHDHDSTPFSAKKNDIIVICDGLQSPANIGAIFRLSDAFGVRKIISNIDFDLSSNRLKRTSRSTESVVSFEVIENIEAFVMQLQKEAYVAVSLEISTHSVPLNALPLLANQKTILIIGNEKHGVSEGLLKLSNHTTHIQMFGLNSSMNVAQATAIALYELTKP